MLNTAKAMRALGANGRAHWARAPGASTASASAAFAQPDGVLDFGNSGTGCRLVMGAVAGCPSRATFDGDASLRKRPMQRILDPLELMGARALEHARRRPAAAHARRRARSDPDRLSHAGALGADQVGGAARRPCRAGRNDGDREREASRDHTERLLAHFGAEVTVEAEGAHGRRITLQGEPELGAGAGRGSGRSRPRPLFRWWRR